tara:strand:- start:1475 stop:2176 length:702 start_codon:yes stop_codon:yes gene_type:complete
MLAKNIMTKDVVTVTPDTSVTEIAATFLERGISAVPVLDDATSIIGIVSEGDLMRRPEADTDKRTGSWWLTIFSDASELASEFRKSHGQTAADVMTKSPIVIPDDMPVAEIAEVLEKNHIKRVPVTRDDALVGIVSRANLLRAIAARKSAPMAPVKKSDEEIHDALMDALGNEGWVERGMINAIVSDGVVQLWGLVRSDAEVEAYAVAARDIPGVKSVENHIGANYHQLYWAE